MTSNAATNTSVVPSVIASFFQPTFSFGQAAASSTVSTKLDEHRIVYEHNADTGGVIFGTYEAFQPYKFYGTRCFSIKDWYNKKATDEITAHINKETETAVKNFYGLS